MPLNNRAKTTCILGLLSTTTILVGCHDRTIHVAAAANAQAPSLPWVSEACAFGSTDINTFIDQSMQDILANRNAATSCNVTPSVAFPSPACPGPTYPAYCGGVSVDSSHRAVGIFTSPESKAPYNNWLIYVAGAIQNYSPTSPAIGQPPIPYEGLGKPYLSLAEAAQTLDQGSYACQARTDNPADDTFHPPGSGPCGKDTDCMQRQLELASFLNVGEGLFLHFKGCSRDIRLQAAQYLQSKYTW
jgi:hypothetical protein